MHIYTLDRWRHSHRFHGDTGRAERNTRRVLWITAAMMVAEIAAGTLCGSMALLADGWHMGTHAAAMGIAALAYAYARRHADDPQYSFGTGKVGALGGFASAVALAAVALMMALESVARFFSPVSIRFNQAIAVAVLGLLVNIACAFLLRHRHDHDDHAGVSGEQHHHDHNLRAAYFHVLADATTSVLAILALAAGKIWGWIWMDPVMGIVGSVIITRWAYVLIRGSSRILLDSAVGQETAGSIRSAIEADADSRVSDLHVWYVGPGHLAGAVSVVTHYPKPPEHYKQLLSGIPELAHVTVEVNPCYSEPCVAV